MHRGQLQAREKLVKREAAEAVIRIQQAAVKSRQGDSTLEDVQAAVDSYASIIGSVSGGGPDAGLKPGDEVMVPSLSAINPFIAPIVKVGAADRGLCLWHTCACVRPHVCVQAAVGGLEGADSAGATGTAPGHTWCFSYVQCCCACRSAVTLFGV